MLHGNACNEKCWHTITITIIDKISFYSITPEKDVQTYYEKPRAKFIVYKAKK